MSTFSSYPILYNFNLKCLSGNKYECMHNMLYCKKIIKLKGKDQRLTSLTMYHFVYFMNVPKYIL